MKDECAAFNVDSVHVRIERYSCDKEKHITIAILVKGEGGEGSEAFHSMKPIRKE